jgi:hypothetical protein
MNIIQALRISSVQPFEAPASLRDNSIAFDIRRSDIHGSDRVARDTNSDQSLTL